MITKDVPHIDLLGVPIAFLSVEESLREVEKCFEHEPPTMMTYANAHVLNLACRDPEYRTLLCERYLVFKDGVGVGIAAKLLGRGFPKNVSFTDFNPLLLGLAAKKGWRVFFLGGHLGVATEAAEKLTQQILGLQVVGTCDGYTEASKAVAAIRDASTDLLVVAMGNPLQEKWLAKYMRETGVRVGLAVGGYLNFASGRRKRAPLWMQRMHIEWFHRLLQEPGRMWRRYVLGIPVFLARVIWAKLRGKHV